MGVLTLLLLRRGREFFKLILDYSTCFYDIFHKKIFWVEKLKFLVNDINLFSFGINEKLNDNKITFALWTIVIIWNCFCLQKITNHLIQISAIITTKIKCHIPNCVKSNRLISTFWTNNSWQNLPTKIVTDYWVFSLFIVVPPVITLNILIIYNLF